MHGDCPRAVVVPVGSIPIAALAVTAARTKKPPPSPQMDMSAPRIISLAYVSALSFVNLSNRMSFSVGY